MSINQFSSIAQDTRNIFVGGVNGVEVYSIERLKNYCVYEYYKQRGGTDYLGQLYNYCLGAGTGEEMGDVVAAVMSNSYS